MGFFNWVKKTVKDVYSFGKSRVIKFFVLFVAITYLSYLTGFLEWLWRFLMKLFGYIGFK